ncbi:MAG: SAM-dependent methyltransferase, partial [Mycobacterium sp.]
LNPDTVSAQVAAAGLDVTDLRHEQIKLEFFDVGAAVYFLRRLSWVVPDFTVTKYRDRLRRMHQQIEAERSFVTHSSRVLIDVRKPS